MVMTQPALAILAGLGTLALIGMFRNFDGATQVLIRFVGAIVWGMFGLGSFDVIVRSTSYASASEPILPLAFLGIGLAVVMALFALLELFGVIRRDAGEVDVEGLF
jgi:uncharacterized membrane protein YuzA (DUF378 family)